MAKYELSQAKLEDFQRCMDILSSGREFQREQGFVQWADGYPDAGTIQADLQAGLGYVLKVDDAIAAYMYIGFDGDPSYPLIQGAWNYDEPYAVVHRIAIDSAFRGQGLSSITFRLVEDFCRCHGFHLLRIDTHNDNERMQHVLQKNGFTCCGIVMQNGGERLAYEKKL